jgi:hypothetical protein
MKVEGYLFSFFTVFFTIGGLVYWFTSKDPTGTAALGISAGMSTLIGAYMLVSAKRTGPRPSDLPEAEVADGAGELGHFSPGSYWPFFIAIFVFLFMLGAVLGEWLAILSAIGAFATLMGLLFEHYITRTAVQQD